MLMQSRIMSALAVIRRGSFLWGSIGGNNQGWFYGAIIGGNNREGFMGRSLGVITGGVLVGDLA